MRDLFFPVWLRRRIVTLFPDPSIRDGKGLSYTDLVEGRGMSTRPAQISEQPQPQPVSIITPSPIAGRAKKGGDRGGSEAEDEDDEGEGRIMDQKMRRQQRRRRKEQGGPSPAPAPAPAPALLASGRIDHAAGVGGAAATTAEATISARTIPAADVASNDATSPVPPSASDFESILQAARESLAAAAASGDTDLLDNYDDGILHVPTMFCIYSESWWLFSFAENATGINDNSAGDVDKCERLLGQGLSVDTTAADGSSLLCIAVAAGQVDIVRLLLQRGANVRSSDALPLAASLPEPTSGTISQLLLQAMMDVGAASPAVVDSGAVGGGIEDGRLLGPQKRAGKGGLSSFKSQILGVFALRKWVKEPEIRKMEADVEKARKLRHKLEGAEVKADDSLKKLIAKANEFVPDVEQVCR